MSGVWTLLHNGTEKSLADWGLRATRLQLRSMAADALELIAASQSTTPPAFSADDKIELFLQTDPTLASTKVRKFTGWMDTKATQERAVEGVKNWVFTGPWRWLERAVFEQTWVKNNSDGTKTTLRWAHCFIPQRVVDSGGGGYVQQNTTTGQQMRAALDYVLELAQLDGLPAPFTVAASFDADVPNLTVPVQEVQNVYCSEVVRLMFRWSPGSVWFDYSTSPPTIYAKPYETQAAVNLSLTSKKQGDYNVIERHDLKHDAVSFTYEQVAQNGSFNSVVDTWPASANPRGFRTLQRAFTFAAPSGLTYAATVRNSLFPGPTNTNGWLNLFKEDHPVLDGERIYGLRVVSALPAPTYTRRLQPNTTVPGWVITIYGPIVQEQLKMDVAYKVLKKDVDPNTPGFDATNPQNFARVVEREEIKINVISTDITPGQKSIWVEYDSGDTVPPLGENGLARKVYDWVSRLQYQGFLNLTAQEVPEDLQLGRLLNLTDGSSAAWATMNSALNTLDLDINTGSARAEFGPPEYLTPQDRITLLQQARQRLTLSNPNAQVNGTIGFNTADVAADAAARASSAGKQSISSITLTPDETNPAEPGVGIFSKPLNDQFQVNLTAGIANARSVRMDTVNGRSVLVIADGDKRITLDTTALPAGAEMAIIAVQVCDPDTNENRTGYVLGYIPGA